MNTRLIGIAAALLAAFCAAWMIQGWRLGGQMLEMQAEWSETLRKTAEANAAVILKQQQDRQALADELASLDEQRYGELRHAQQEIDRLSAAVADGSKRLSVRASCPAASVPATTSPGGLDAGAQRIDIHPADAAAIVRITGDADQCAVKLSALQDWARSVTRGN
ncbi:lysis system i-spanin subunit Rz [Stutzerimonas nitrititolerans]